LQVSGDVSARCSRRGWLRCLAGGVALMAAPPLHADASGPVLAAYYDRHAALLRGTAWGWTGRGQPARLRDGARQVGVGKDAWYLLLDDGTLLRQGDDGAAAAVLLMRGVQAFASGESGWFAIDRERMLWHGGSGKQPSRVAQGVLDAAIGDGADYYIAADGRLFVTGLAHRGQYGDGRLQASPGYTATASEVVAVKAHTGHAIALRRDGSVIGTGGNRFGPLSSHGLGDKADRWGPIFDGAVAIATGSRHSAAIRADGSLWAWGQGFGIAPVRLRERVVAVAAGDMVTLALDADGALWQWDDGVGPRRLSLP
jgi:Regulator of chromosome condensation (RCC1) repeat